MRDNSARDWFVDQLEWFFPLIIILVVAIALFSAGAAGIMALNRASCDATAEAMGVNWSWGPLQNCMIVVNGKSIPLSAYKVVKVAQQMPQHGDVILMEVTQHPKWWQFWKKPEKRSVWYTVTAVVNGEPWERKAKSSP